MKKQATCSFGIQKNEFPKIKFFSCKQRKEDISAINKDQYLKAVNLLNEKGQYEDALLTHIMWSLASSPKRDVNIKIWGFWRQKWEKDYIILCK